MYHIFFHESFILILLVQVLYLNSLYVNLFQALNLLSNVFNLLVFNKINLFSFLVFRNQSNSKFSIPKTYSLVTVRKRVNELLEVFTPLIWNALKLHRIGSIHGVQYKIICKIIRDFAAETFSGSMVMEYYERLPWPRARWTRNKTWKKENIRCTRRAIYRLALVLQCVCKFWY